MIPKIHRLDRVWIPLIAWAKRRNAERAIIARRNDREFQRRVALAANALVNAAVTGFVRGVLIGVTAIALLYCLATCGPAWL